MGVYDGGGKMGKNSTQTGAGGPQGTGGASKGKGDGGGGAGTQAVAGKSNTQPRDPAGPKGAISGGSIEGPGARSYSTSSDIGGGTTTQEKYTPGAVGNFPKAKSPLTNLLEGAALAPTSPGGIIGAAARAAYYGATGDADPMTDGKQASPFSDTGPQRGYQPDRYRGAASLGGIGGSGGAVNSGDREIPGQSSGAGSRMVKGDSDNDEDGLGGGTPRDQYSDVMLRDRRRSSTSLKQMLETML